MKKYFMAIALCLVCAISFGQDRVNRVKLSFGNEGYVLDKVIGWAYDNSVGEWIDCVNLIEENKQYIKFATSPSWMSHRFNNIISLQFKTVTCNDIPYYVLVWEKWDGAYKYPSIYEDWEFWKTKLFMMFTEENMRDLRNLTNDPITIKVSTPSRKRYDEREDVDVIQASMSNSFQSESSIIIYKATDGSVRFMFKQYSLFDSIDNQYFEISETEYLKLIDITF